MSDLVGIIQSMTNSWTVQNSSIVADSINTARPDATKLGSFVAFDPAVWIKQKKQITRSSRLIGLYIGNWVHFSLLFCLIIPSSIRDTKMLYVNQNDQITFMGW